MRCCDDQLATISSTSEEINQRQRN